jgi:hypothetical protein
LDHVVQAARELNMDVVVEGGMAFYWNLNEIMDGHTTIEHSLPMAPLYNDVGRTPLHSSRGPVFSPESARRRSLSLRRAEPAGRPR